ncbi:microfibrillar-associated protein 5 [Eublepharis macularius]|uniref:Microfibrillar-associated protein 5 n=1 Tax=Eublepharis macularius TaxID=481883 RepID=A0AA97KN56_EUBMA|nr:microfibrillar-associated protein 5 [Eublepharis macularius]
MTACGAQRLLCLIALTVLPADWLLPVVFAQEDSEVPTGVPGPGATLPALSNQTAVPECREEQFPCTRLYSVHKPVKQCISYLCVTSVRRTYMINKEICSRIVCKEDEAMQDEICRQLAGLPPRRLRRSNQHRAQRCRQTQDQQQNGIEAQ